MARLRLAQGGDILSALSRYLASELADRPLILHGALGQDAPGPAWAKQRG